MMTEMTLDELEAEWQRLKHEADTG
jgi:hypothetical protein